MVVRIAANLILTTNDITESIQWGNKFLFKIAIIIVPLGSITNRSHSTYGSKLNFSLREYFNCLFAYLVITYYSLQFLSNGDTIHLKILMHEIFFLSNILFTSCYFTCACLVLEISLFGSIAVHIVVKVFHISLLQNVGQKEDLMHSNFQMDISLPWIDAAFT
jgi:hypothetical protein